MANDRVPGVMPDSQDPKTSGSEGNVTPDASRSDVLDTGVGANQDLAHNLHSDASGGDHPAGNDLCLDDALLGAVNSMSPDMVSMIDHTLDHLTSAADLFDVPPLDFHDVGSS
jgi:hypothetical protein